MRERTRTGGRGELRGEMGRRDRKLMSRLEDVRVMRCLKVIKRENHVEDYVCMTVCFYV